MIGITKISSGRMGNRLLQYHFLRQIAKKTGLGYFHPKFPDVVYFDGMKKISRPFSLPRRQIIMTTKDILALSPADFLSFIAEKNSAGFDIILDPPILGDLFFDYLFYPPGEFVVIKNKYQKDFDFDTPGKVIVGLHFRGTDFKEWNEHASLNAEYYKKAIAFCGDAFSNMEVVYALFTDDNSFPAFLETVTYLKENNLNVHISNNLKFPIIDFYQMSQCDVLISSPSTFAIFAGCIGKEKKIIHSKDWLDYSISRSDRFWVELAKTNNPYYSLLKTF